MSKYRLTFVFVLISVLTLGTAAFALNYLAARTAETNLVELTTEQSKRDASIIAGIVNQLLVDQGVESAEGPTRLAHTIPIESQKLLDSLRVIDISLYNAAGQNLWSTSGDLISERTVPSSVFKSASNGRVSSSLGTVEIRSLPEFRFQKGASAVAGTQSVDLGFIVWLVWVGIENRIVFAFTRFFIFRIIFRQIRLATVFVIGRRYL